jgi:DNA replication protein DnaC
VQRAEKEQWSYDALLLTLFSEEVAHRRGTRLTRAVSAAALPFLRTIDEFDFTYQSTLRLTTIGSLLTPDFVTEGHSVILEGKPGRGKTHLAIALAYRAMQNGFDALFTTAAELIDELSAASKDGQLRDALARYIKPHVLVVDEVGYLPYGDDAASVLYHVVNDRHIRHRAMVFTTNKHPKRWGDVLHDDDLAEAIVDRVLERGRLLRLDGPSLRTKHLPDDELQLNQDIQGDRRVSGKDPAEFPERTGAMDGARGGMDSSHDVPLRPRPGAPPSREGTAPARAVLVTGRRGILPARAGSEAGGGRNEPAREHREVTRRADGRDRGAPPRGPSMHLASMGEKRRPAA